MNREQMKRGYDSMTPDHAARQRMLQRIMEQGGQTMNNEYSAQPQKNKGWLGTLAACLAVLILVAGLVSLMRGRNPDINLEDPTGETTAPINPNAMEEFMDTAFYKAAVACSEGDVFSDSVLIDREKLEEIAGQYMLITYSGDDVGTDDYSYFLRELQLDSFIRGESGKTAVEIDSCWWYDEARFNVAGTVTFDGENPIRATPLDFNFYRTGPEYLLLACCQMGRLENYETWLYPVSSGDTAILAMGSNKAYVIVSRPEEILFVEVSNWIYLDSEPVMTREAVEAVAQLFDFSLSKSTAQAPADWGVDIIVGQLSRTSADITFRDYGILEDGELSYNDQVHILRLEDGEWKEVMRQGYHPESLRDVINGEGDSHDWKRRFGELPDGQYRFGRPVILTLSDGTSFEQVVYAEFSLPEDLYTGPVPLEELPADYSWEQAVKDGCYVQVNGEYSANQGVFHSISDAFIYGKPKTIRIVHFFTQEEPYSLVYDLTNDGNVYTISWMENGKRQTKEYLYLRHLSDYPKDENATYAGVEHYLLVNDDSALNWSDFLVSLASSEHVAAADYMVLYSRYMGDFAYEVVPLDVKQVDLEFQGEILYTSTDPEIREKISQLELETEYLDYPPKTHNIGIGLNMILTLETGHTVTYELDTNEYYCRVNGIYWRFGGLDDPTSVAKLWDCLGIDAWPEEVYEVYPNAHRG